MLNSYFTDSAIRVVRTKDKWGTTTSETETTMKCRLVYDRKLMTDQNGQKVLSPIQVLLDDSNGDAIDFEDRIKLNGVEHQIVNKTQVKDFSKRGWRLYLA